MDLIFNTDASLCASHFCRLIAWPPVCWRGSVDFPPRNLKQIQFGWVLALCQLTVVPCSYMPSLCPLPLPAALSSHRLPANSLRGYVFPHQKSVRMWDFHFVVIWETTASNGMIPYQVMLWIYTRVWEFLPRFLLYEIEFTPGPETISANCMNPKGHKMRIVWGWFCWGWCHATAGVKIPFQWGHIRKVTQLFLIIAAIWYSSGSLWLISLLLWLQFEQLMVSNR